MLRVEVRYYKLNKKRLDRNILKNRVFSRKSVIDPNSKFDLLYKEQLETPIIPRKGEKVYLSDYDLSKKFFVNEIFSLRYNNNDESVIAYYIEVA